MDSDENITAWFTDVAIRHPEILHTTKKPRFFEMEWDEIIQSGTLVAAPSWTLVLEDHEEALEDSGSDYYSRRPKLAFMVVRTVPIGQLTYKKETYAGAKRIAESILAKLWTDCDKGLCDADVPAGVRPPVKVLLNTRQGTRVGPVPAFDQAFGYRIAIDIRTDGDVDLDASHTAWITL